MCPSAGTPRELATDRAGFLNRNETLTALSEAVTVVATDGSGGTMTTYKTAKKQGKQIYCPDPELQLEPVGGIREIASKDATPIRDATEIFADQDQDTGTPDNEHPTDGNENTDSQTTFQEFS